LLARGGLKHRVTDSNAKWFALVAACFALFMAILDNLVVNIALPTIALELDATTTQVQWIVSAYTLFFASLQISGGGLGDRFGRKRWFLIGIAIFTVTSLLAAFSQSIEMLIAMRAVQGVGAALIMPLSLSLISEAFPPEERGKALGIWSAVSVSGIALGPVVGGVLVEYATWNWVFLINVPIGIGAYLVTAAVVRESCDTSGTVATDVPGTLLITAAIASLTWGLIEAGNRGWTDGMILGAFGLAILFGAAFVYVEAHTARPMVPLRFFRASTFTGANIDAFALSFLLAGVAFIMTLYQQNVHGFSAVRTGLSLLPMVATTMIFSPIAGVMIGRVGPSRLISVGMLITAAGTLLFLRAGVDASYLDIVPAFVVLGFGMSFIWAPMSTAVLNSVESFKSGVASAINGAGREIGTAFGIALLGTVLNRVYQARYNAAPAVNAIKSDPATTTLSPIVDAIGSGATLAGNGIGQVRAELARSAESAPLLAALDQVYEPLWRASAYAFVDGMEWVIYVAAAVITAAAVLSYFLVDDRVVNQRREPEETGAEATQTELLVPSAVQ